MGCYMSTPDEKVYVTEGKGASFRYATASCQGWRREQEDAEECIPYYDDDASLFVLCDGHGGAEVAKYTVDHFPDFLKKHPLYKEGKYEDALRKAFIDFDALLRTDKVIAELNKIAFDEEQSKNQNDEDEKDSDKDNKSKTNENEMDTKEEELATSSSSAASHSNSNNAGASSSASTSGVASSSVGPSSSSNNGPSSIVEDVDTETLRREAQLPLDVLIDKYSGQPPVEGRARSVRQTSLNLTGSPVIRPSKDANGEDDGDESDTEVKKEGTEQPSSSKTAEEGESSSGSIPNSGNSIYQQIFKKALEQYFDGNEDDDDSENDSEFDGNEESDSDDDDEDDDDEDGDDERDEENTAESTSKSKKLRHKRNRHADQSESSSEDDTEDDDDDDDDDDQNGEDNDEEDDDEAEDEGDVEEEEVEEEEEEGEELDGRFSCLRKINQNLKAASRLHKPGIDSGCTVVVALIKGNQLYVASAGDSRCIVIMRNGNCIPMSFDHKPEDKDEHNRIRKAGGRVTDGRVNGGLNLSRAFGDFSYKESALDAAEQMITPVPDIKTFLVDPYKVEYILLACDGIWNSMNNHRVAKFIRKTAPNVKNDLVELCLALFRNCIAPRTDGDGTGCDNMTCILVKYNDLEDNKLETTDTTETATTNLQDLKNSSDEIDGSKTMTSKNNDSHGTTVSNKRPADDSAITFAVLILIVTLQGSSGYQPQDEAKQSEAWQAQTNQQSLLSFNQQQHRPTLFGSTQHQQHQAAVAAASSQPLQWRSQGVVMPPNNNQVLAHSHQQQQQPTITSNTHSNSRPLTASNSWQQIQSDPSLGSNSNLSSASRVQQQQQQQTQTNNNQQPTKNNNNNHHHQIAEHSTMTNSFLGGNLELALRQAAGDESVFQPASSMGAPNHDPDWYHSSGANFGSSGSSAHQNTDHQSKRQLDAASGDVSAKIATTPATASTTTTTSSTTMSPPIIIDANENYSSVHNVDVLAPMSNSISFNQHHQKEYQTNSNQPIEFNNQVVYEGPATAPPVGDYYFSSSEKLPNHNVRTSNAWWAIGIGHQHERASNLTRDDYLDYCDKSQLLVSNKQRSLCRLHPKIMKIVARGLRMAIDECQARFANSRWNCSIILEDSLALDNQSKVSHVFGDVMQHPNRERSYLNSIIAAGLAHAMTKACSQNELPEECSCDKKIRSRSNKGKIEWVACSDDIDYGAKFSRDFTDNFEIESDSTSTIYLHNNEVGRRVFKSAIDITCTCLNGEDGSCLTKRCWRQLGPFADVGDELMKRYESATHVQRSNRDPHKLRPVRRGVRKPKRKDLVYIDESPDYCQSDVRIGVLGTHNRHCNSTSSGPDSCSLLCCGRGYQVVMEEIEEDCNCKFVWCCEVKCDKCKRHVTKDICN